MSILIIFNNKDPKPWLHELSRRLPQVEMAIDPDGIDLAAVDFVICWRPMKNQLDLVPNVKVVQSVGAGVYHVLSTNTLRSDVALTRIIDPCLTNDMWEFLLAGVLLHLKNIPTYFLRQREKNWAPSGYQTIKETTLVVLGLGRIGSPVAANFAKMGFRVKGWSTSKKEIKGVQSYEGADELLSCLDGCDVLINLLPLTPATTGLLNYQNLINLNKGAFLINVGRGQHVIEKDLINLLDKSHLSGALLDVFGIEPLPTDHPFWCHPKILVTPHIASLTNMNSAIEQIVENYRRYSSGQNLLNQVSIAEGY